MEPRHLILILTVLAASPLGQELQAQSSAEPLRGRAMGVSMDRFNSGESALIAMSYRYSSLHPGGIGVELGVSVFPQALPAGILATAPDLGAAYNLTIPGGSVLIKAGGSAVAIVGMEGALLVPGVHLGGTLLLKTGNLSGVRLDVIHHRYWAGEGEIDPVWSIGLGFAILPRRR
jgi:hypothetical protein